jgi:hypothetical protein
VENPCHHHETPGATAFVTRPVDVPAYIRTALSTRKRREQKLVIGKSVKLIAE